MRIFKNGCNGGGVEGGGGGGWVGSGKFFTRNGGKPGMQEWRGVGLVLYWGRWGNF